MSKRSDELSLSYSATLSTPSECQSTTAEPIVNPSLAALQCTLSRSVFPSSPRRPSHADLEHVCGVDDMLAREQLLDLRGTRRGTRRLGELAHLSRIRAHDLCGQVWNEHRIDREHAVP